ncbi:hypothetical protein Hanom_Chr13g01245001 [Helianthus anomalus]
MNNPRRYKRTAYKRCKRFILEKFTLVNKKRQLSDKIIHKKTNLTRAEGT